MQHPSTPAAPLFAFTFSQASCTSHFEISNDLPDDFSSPIQTPPEPTVRLIEQTQPRMTGPLGSTPTASSGSFPATTSQSASAPRIGTPSRRCRPSGNLPLATSSSGSIGTRLLTFRTGAADQAHVASMPGTTWPVNGPPPGSSRDYPPAPVSMPANLFRHVNGYNARLPDPRLTREPGLLPHRSPRQSSANAAVGGLKPPPAGRLRRAKILHLLHSTTSRSSPITLPSAFVTHVDRG